MGGGDFCVAPFVGYMVLGGLYLGFPLCETIRKKGVLKIGALRDPEDIGGLQADSHVGRILYILGPNVGTKAKPKTRETRNIFKGNSHQALTG